MALIFIGYGIHFHIQIHILNFYSSRLIFRHTICLLKADWQLTPNVAKAGGLQSQGVKGEVVVVYRDPFTIQDLKSSGFPVVLGCS